MKHIFLIAIVVVGSAFCLEVLADGCSTIDYRDELGEERDQGNSGTCYANTTSDLATQVLGFRVSEVGIAKSFLSQNPEKLKSRKDPDIQKFLSQDPEIINRIKEDRTTEPDRWHPKNMLSYEKSYDQDGHPSVSYNGLFNTGGSEDGALMMANLDGFCRAEQLSAKGDKDYVKYSRDINEYIGRSEKEVECPPTATSGQLSKNTVDLSKIVLKSFSNWVDEKCGDRVHPNPPLIPEKLYLAKDLDEANEKLKSGELKLEEKQKKIFAEIDRNLERHRVSAIGYDYQEHVGKKGPEDHSAVIAARKMINGQCRYFLRNSIGAGCSEYSTKYRGLPLCEAEKGGIWVTPDEIKSVYSVVSVK